MRNYIKIVSVFFLFFLFSSLANAQYNFGYLDYKNELSHNHVQCFAEDNNGFLWIGTRSGLNRYDGYNIKIFRHNPDDSTSIPSNVVQAMVKDQLGRFWLKLPYEMCIFNPITEKFTNDFTIVSQNNIYSNSSIEMVVPYRDSTLFLLIPGEGIVKHNIITNQNLNINLKPSASASDYSQIISHLTVKNNLLYVTYQNGVIDIIYADSLKLFKRIDVLQKTNNFENILFESFIDDDNNIWAFCIDEAKGIFKIDSEENVKYYSTDTKPALNSNNISCIIQFTNDNLWIGTDHGGINILNTKSDKIKFITHDPYNENSLKQNVITELYLSKDSIIWIGTFKQGVNYYHENIYRFWHYVNFPNKSSTLPYNDVNCFAEDKFGNLWIGTNGYGLIYFDRKKNRFKTIKADKNNKDALQSNVIVSLYLDEKNNLWVGTYHGGLSFYDGVKFRNFLHDPKDKTTISDNKVWDIFKDSRNNIWVGTLGGGLDLLDQENMAFKHYSSNGLNSLNSNFVMDITEDDDGNIWYAAEEGVFVLDYQSGRIIQYRNDPSRKNSLSDNFVSNVFKDSKGHIWAGTRNGLNLFDKKQNAFIPLKFETQLGDIAILSILESDDGNLWLGTSFGLIKLVVSYDEQGNYKSHYLVIFNESDGLQGREFNEGSALKTRKGELIFGGSNGFNLFIPEKDINYTHHAIPKIIGLEIFGKTVGVNELINGNKLIHSAILNGSKIKLKSTENMFSLNFVLINFLTPRKVHYRYKLEGFDDQWITTSWENRKATFTNLNPGNYKFIVQSSDFKSDWNESEASLEIVVLAPWYKTVYAYAVYIVLIALFLIGMRNYIVIRMRNKYLKKNAEEESLRQHELNALKTRFFTNVSHEFRTPLTLILTPLDSLLKKDLDTNTKKHLQLIRQNAGRLLNLVNQLLDFRKAEGNKLSVDLTYGNIVNLLRQTVESFRELSESKNIDLQFLSYVPELFMQFDKDKMEKIINNLLSNAFKFTKEGGGIHVISNLISVDDKETLEIKVMDMGIGIEKEHRDKLFERFYQVNMSREFVTTGSGIGLSLTKEFVELMNGKISVESEEGKGSCFTVIIPVNRERISNAEEEIEDENVQLKEEKPETTTSKHKKTILLVEDNLDFRSYLKESLSDKYNIMEADNGKMGLEMLENKDADLIVSDIMMPVMDGIQFCQSIKTNPEFSHIPIILLTAKSTHGDKVEGFKEGADEYITKPFDLDILESRIEYLINLRKKFFGEYQENLSIESNTKTLSNLDEKLLNKILELINSNIANPDFSVNGLSSDLGISRVHLYKKTLALVDKTPIELIRLVRLKKAAELLLTGQYTVSEISYEVGFSDPRYFSKMFKNEFGKLPSKYKEEQSGKK